MASPHQPTPDFVALDIANLASAADADGNKDSSSSSPNSTPRLLKGVSRKGSLRLGGETIKIKIPAPPVEGDATTFPITGGVQGHVAAIEEPVSVPRVSTPTAGGGKYRRLGSSRRAASSSWVDPRRVLFVFATLSSMGTLILLYFTLSMAKMSGSSSDSVADSQ